MPATQPQQPVEEFKLHRCPVCRKVIFGTNDEANRGAIQLPCKGCGGKLRVVKLEEGEKSG